MRGFVAIVGCILVLGVMAMRGFGTWRPGKTAAEARPPQRIVSLAPGITESLYAMGLGDRVAGVTRYCDWPPQAAVKPRVGGFREISLEALARTRPDLVVLPDDMAHFIPQIQALGARVLPFDNRTLAGFRRDLVKLGEICGAGNKAAELADSFKAAGNVAGQKNAPRALFVLMSPDECARPITELTALGPEGFYNDLLQAAGGVNAYAGKVPYPRLSREAIMKMNPDALIVAAAGCPDPKTIEKNWRALGSLKALANGHFLLLMDAGDTIPGPRSLDTLRKISGVLENAK